VVNLHVGQSGKLSLATIARIEEAAIY